MRQDRQTPEARPTEPLFSDASDRDLVVAFQAGDDRAYEELYRRHIQRVRHVCRRLLTDPQDAEEAAQETFLRGFQAFSRFNGQYQVGAWLARIASNVCVDQLRSRQRHIRVVDLGDDEIEDLEGGARPDATVADQMELASTLRSIRPLHARALMLRTLQGLSHQEMAGELEMTPGQVKALLHRARSSFRRAWQNASGWGLAPLAWLRSLVTERPREAAAAGDGAAAGLATPAGQVVLEKMAASAVAAALALSGTPTISGDDNTVEDAPRSFSVAERAGADAAGTARGAGNRATTNGAGTGEAQKGRLGRVLLTARAAFDQTLEKEEPEEESRPDDRDRDEPTTGPTVSAKPAKDKAKEAKERVEEVKDNLP